MSISFITGIAHGNQKKIFWMTDSSQLSSKSASILFFVFQSLFKCNISGLYSLPH